MRETFPGFPGCWKIRDLAGYAEAIAGSLERQTQLTMLCVQRFMVIVNMTESRDAGIDFGVFGLMTVGMQVSRKVERGPDTGKRQREYEDRTRKLLPCAVTSTHMARPTFA